MATQYPKIYQRHRFPLYKLVLSQSTITKEVLEHQWEGDGTTESPYLVEWLHDDPRDPHQMQDWLKWSITLLQAASFLSITFASSSLSAANTQIQEQFGASSQLVIADTSLFVLAFAIGPAVWAPLSELYGRQVIYFITYGLTTLFAGVTIASPNIATLLVLRFLSGAFGSSAISNAGGVVSDMYTARDRGLATIAFIGAPFLGPSLGPIACDFLAVSKGWKWVQGLTTIFNGVLFLVGIVLIPETYSPVLLQKRAAKLSKMTGAVYKSRLDVEQGHRTASQVFTKTMVRPWILLFLEPIVLLLSIYMAISKSKHGPTPVSGEVNFSTTVVVRFSLRHNVHGIRSFPDRIRRSPPLATEHFGAFFRGDDDWTNTRMRLLHPRRWSIQENRRSHEPWSPSPGGTTGSRDGRSRDTTHWSVLVCMDKLSKTSLDCVPNWNGALWILACLHFPQRGQLSRGRLHCLRRVRTGRECCDTRPLRCSLVSSPTLLQDLV